MKKSAEIVVIGGGVMGASIAYHLTALGARDVLVLERGPLCSGETAKSGGFIQTHWSSLDEVRLIHHSREVFANWKAQIGGDCAYQPIGYLHVTGEERQEAVREVHQMLLDEGLESHWLSPLEMKKLQPLLRVDDLVGGAYESSSGWADPVATTRSFAEAAQRQGAILQEGVQAVQIAHRSGAITGVETDQGFVAAPTVVLAAGPWTPNLHPLAHCPLPIQAKRGQVCYMNRPGGLPRKELAFYDEITGLYSHPDGESNLVGLDWHFEVVWGADRYERRLDADYLQAAHSALTHRFPSLRGSVPVKGVVGIYDFTPDGHPIVDGPIGGLQGYYVAAGFSGAGFKSSPALGLGMAEMVLKGQATSVNLDFLRLSRFDQDSSQSSSSSKGRAKAQ